VPSSDIELSIFEEDAVVELLASEIDPDAVNEIVVELFPSFNDSDDTMTESVSELFTFGNDSEVIEDASIYESLLVDIVNVGDNELYDTSINPMQPVRKLAISVIMINIGVHLIFKCVAILVL